MPVLPVAVLPDEIDKFPDRFPSELITDILFNFVKDVGRDSDCYQEFLREPKKSSRFLRKTLLHQEDRHLSNDQAVAEYARKALEFHKWLGPFGISFGSLYLLELAMPSTSSLSAQFCKAFAVSRIIQLNLDCEREDFLQDVLTWTEGLAQLEVLRVKYRRRMTQDGPDHLYPWHNPQWLQMLSLCTNLKVLALSTYLPLYEDPMASNWEPFIHPEISIVEDWSQHLPSSFKRAYLRHGRDDYSPISSPCSFGENVLVELKTPDEEIIKYTPSRWNIVHLKKFDQTRMSVRGESTIREEDVDFYATTDSDASDSPDDDEDKEQDSDEEEFVLQP